MSLPGNPHRSTVALVTGANKGIGRETARQLGRLGMTVFASARDEARGRRAVLEIQQEAGDVRFVQLDVTDAGSVKRAALHIHSECGRLDVLVNNAAVIVDAERPSKTRSSTSVDPFDITAVDLRFTYETNVFGVVRVTREMLPLLRRSEAARIVNVSSPLGSLSLRADSARPIARTGILAYASSKTALNAVTLHYANALRRSRILVNAANPGLVATDLNTHTGHRTVEEGASIVLRLATLADDGPTGTFQEDDGIVPW